VVFEAAQFGIEAADFVEHRRRASTFDAPAGSEIPAISA